VVASNASATSSAAPPSFTGGPRFDAESVLWKVVSTVVEGVCPPLSTAVDPRRSQFWSQNPSAVPAGYDVLADVKSCNVSHDCSSSLPDTSTAKADTLHMAGSQATHAATRYVDA
jgi:hypothetical protein